MLLRIGLKILAAKAKGGIILPRLDWKWRLCLASGLRDACLLLE